VYLRTKFVELKQTFCLIKNKIILSVSATIEYVLILRLFISRVMSQFTPLFILLDILAIVSLLIGIFTSSLILFIVVRTFKHHHAITNLLLANTSVCTLELCLSDLIIYGFIIASDFPSMTSITSLYDQRTLCPIRSYFLFTGFSLLYTSYCLQAYFRLRQVVFYKKRHSYKSFVYLCLIQWVFSFLLVLPMLLTKSFVYIPTEFFCPIPFNKPLSVVYIAVSVYGVFLTIFASIYLWIYVYATRTALIISQRRRINDRHLTMLKRIVLPTFSLMFLGIVYLTLFFQAIANQYKTHFLTYRLSYLFIAIGMSFVHIITILQSPPIKRVVLVLLYKLKRKINRKEESLNNVVHYSTSSNQQQREREDEQYELLDNTEIKLSQLEQKTPSDHQNESY
jgi:hypothetical protein